MDPRYNQLAKVLTTFSTNLASGDNVLIDAQDVPEDIVIAIVRAARDCGANPFVVIQKARISRELLKGGSANEYAGWSRVELERMKNMHAYIALRGSNNIFESSDVPA